MVKPVYALVGSDSFLQLQTLREILAEMPPDVQRVDVDGERAELAEVLDELRSYAMFGGAKLVVVRDADAFISRFREQLEDYVANPSQSGTLVLRLNTLPANQRIYKAIAKTGKIEDCNPPKDVVRWITDHGQAAHGIKLSPDAARLMAELVGNDLGRLDGELAKLALQCDGGKVDAGNVTDCVAFQREQEMWDMTNEVAAGNIAEALRRWRHLCQLDSSAEFRAVTWLGMWLEKVRRALQLRREGKNDFVIAKELKIWPMDQQKPFFQTASNIGEAGAGRLIELLTDIDYRSKNGLGDMKDNVERFLLSVKS